MLLVLGLFSSPSVGQKPDKDWVGKCRTMVERYVAAAGVHSDSVLDAMRATPRHEFVPKDVRRRAYRDVALPIGHQQTISSPYIVAMMTQSLEPQRNDRVLEVGTGSGYQAAILSPLVKDVYTIEIVPQLGQRAEQTLGRLGYKNVHVRVGDGYQGWPQYAPFDKIIVTCSPEAVPQPLVDQLAEGGHLVIPVGERFQQTLFKFTKRDGQLHRQRLESTFFVPMTGRAEDTRVAKNTAGLSLRNGNFESQVDGEPAGWYYIRRGKLRSQHTSTASNASANSEPSADGDGDRANHWLAFGKEQQAEVANALQSFGVNGKEHPQFRLAFRSRGRQLKRPRLAIHAAQIIIEFYDAQRAPAGHVSIPLPADSFDWQQQTHVVDVPEKASSAILGVGLFGVTGHLDIDDIQLLPLQE